MAALLMLMLMLMLRLRFLSSRFGLPYPDRSLPLPRARRADPSRDKEGRSRPTGRGRELAF